LIDPGPDIRAGSYDKTVAAESCELGQVGIGTDGRLSSLAMRYSPRRILHPERYQGAGRRSGPYFEGWYFKLVDRAAAQRWAVIPGIFLAADPAQSEAFVQVLDGVRGRSHYFAYPACAFSAAEDAFDVRVGESRFAADGISLCLADAEARVRGDVCFDRLEAWPVRWRAPGVMGWYAWVPFMECYHGVLSFDHRLAGEIDLLGANVRFDEGRGYIEKDWGQAFPSAYVWMQSNHFATRGTCLSASVAMIPWVRRAFRGFIVGLRHEGRLHRFATYTGARIERLVLDDAHVDWVMADRRHRLALRATRAEGGLLHAPVRTEMHRRVNETLRSRVSARLETREGRVLFEDTGEAAALEVHGDLERLLAAT
jgi:tocopherol cyclase